MHSHGQFKIINEPNMHVFEQGKEAGVPGENPSMHRENMQTPHSRDSNQEPSCCEETVLTTTPPCSPI